MSTRRQLPAIVLMSGSTLSPSAAKSAAGYCYELTRLYAISFDREDGQQSRRREPSSSTTSLSLRQCRPHRNSKGSNCDGIMDIEADASIG
ncbi:hypothetical protein EV127DRAFT_444806 [Xylaria flabelliformis]|nr:hypothetical protein EV127DRAFT_444806 [Xylaria flabelliformis]